MYVSRLMFHTRAGQTQAVEDGLHNLCRLVSEAGGVDPRVLRTHMGSDDDPDVVFGKPWRLSLERDRPIEPGATVKIGNWEEYGSMRAGLPDLSHVPSGRNMAQVVWDGDVKSGWIQIEDRSAS